MSADNWALCPFCVADFRAVFEVEKQDLENAYGKVPAAEYEIRRAELPAAFDPRSVGPTLREDYELGFQAEPDPSVAESTTAMVHYEARCQTCGASAKFEGTITLVRK